MSHKFAVSRLMPVVVALFALLGTGLVALGMAPPVQGLQPGTQTSIVKSTPAPNTPHVLDGYVSAFVELGNVVVVGGNFTSIRTESSTTAISRNHIFAFDKTTGQLTPFNAQVNGEVTSLEPTGDGKTFWAGGTFSSVNGQTVRRVVKLDVDGQRVTAFKPPVINSKVNEVLHRDGKLFIAGRFTMVGGAEHHLFAALDPATGKLLPGFRHTFSGLHNGGALSIAAADVDRNATKFVGVGNFQYVDGQYRRQLVVLDLTSQGSSVANWATQRYTYQCAKAFDSYMKDVDLSPDGKWFVAVTTGAGFAGTLCDAAARFDLNQSGTSILETWSEFTGGDTLTKVAITDATVYVGGHQRWLNNPGGRDFAGPGAVVRTGLGALDPRSGSPFRWNPGRTRGYGVYGFVATDQGLWIGSDTDRIGPYFYKGRMAFMPVAGGTQLPLERTGTLPGSVFSLSSTAPGGDPEAITRRELSASGIGAVTPGPSGGTWSLVRGAFMADNRLYTGSSDGTFNVRSFDGSTFGSPTAIQLNGLTSFANDLDSVNGMFYDVERGRMYFTQTSVNALYYRKFQLESEVVGASKFASVNGSLPAAGASPALDWRNIRSAFLVDGKLYTALTDGNLYSWQWSSAQGRPVSGTRALVSGPALDRQDWRARDAFNLPQASQ